MTIRTFIEDTVPGLRGLHLAILIVCFAIVAVCAWLVVDRVFFAPHRAHVAAITAAVENKAAAEAVETGKDALATTQQVQVVHDRIERITREHETRILAAPGASDAIPPAVDAAFLGAICVRDNRAADPACVSLSGTPAAVSDGANS